MIGKVTKASGLFPDMSGAGTADNSDLGFLQVMNRTKQELGESLSDIGQGRSDDWQKTSVQVEKPAKQEAVRKDAAQNDTKAEGMAEEDPKAEALEKETSGISDEKDEETLEEQKQAVSDAAEKIADAVKKELGLSDEQLLAVMETLGITQIDLLRPEVMQEIAVEAAGDGDAFKILTDEGLYESVQLLTGIAEETVSGLQEQLGLSGDAFADILSEMEVTAEPEILENAELLQELEAGKETVTFEKQMQAGPVQETDAEAEETRAGKEAPETENASAGQTISAEENRVSAKETEAEDGKESDTRDREDQKKADTASHGAGNETTVHAEIKNNNQIWEMESLQSEAELPYESADVENIMKQVTENIKLQANADVTELEMQLHPETLGTLRIHLTAKEGVLTAQFTTENESVKAVLEAQAVQLKENLDNQGIKVEAVEVVISNPGFERSFDQNREQSGESEEPKKKGIRRIQLGDGESLDELEIDEEDRLTAEMMELHGNSIDYMA